MEEHHHCRLDSEEPPRAEAGGFTKTKNKKKKNTATEGSKRVKRETNENSKKVRRETNEGSKKVKREKNKDGSKKSRKVKKEKHVDRDRTETTMTTQAGPQGHPIVEQWVQRALDMSVDKLREEFRGLAKYTSPGMTQNAFNKNQFPEADKTKNRYQDVPCQDQFIVPMNSQPPNDYIHANYVATPQSKTRFICTQGPLDQTVEDFWFMIVQQKVEQIIMLCKTIETGKYKCAQYWPANASEKRTFETTGITVENMTGAKPMERDNEIQVTMLNVTVNGQTMSVRHLHWTDWPDRGVPPCKLTSLELLSAVRGSKAPIVVHCSAGIGRTGTIVAIEYILEKISMPEKDKDLPPMPDLVKQIRDYRAYSIQNDIQYLYIHRVMLNYFLEKYKTKYAGILTPENVAKYEKFVKDYNTAVGQ